MTTTTAPSVATPRTLVIAVTLGGFKFTPEILKPDGFTRKRHPELVLEAAYEGDEALEDLFGFLTHVRGDLKIAITHDEESPIQGWQGIGVLGTIKLELSDETAVRFPIKIQSHEIQNLEDLIGVRLAMSSEGEARATLELEAVQPDLDFEDGDDDDEA